MRHAVLIFALLLAGLTAAGPPAAAARQPGADPTFQVELPLIVDGRRSGSALVETSVRALVSVDAGALARQLAPALSASAADALAALGPGQVLVAEYEALGLEVDLDPAALTVVVAIPASLRAAQTASLGAAWEEDAGEAIRPDASAFAVTGALQVFETLDDGRDPAADLDLDGFANLGGHGGLSLDWGGRVLWRPDGGSRFDRRPIVLFKDDPARARRWSAGELAIDLGARTGAPALLGAAFEIDRPALQPARNIRPAGARSLVLERRAMVEVLVNGVMIDRFEAEPGPLNLSDIPIANLSNDVTIIVEDAFGRREADRFTLSADVSLLRAGLTEFAATAGFARDSAGFDLTYDYGRPIAGFRVARGLTGAMTIGASAAASEAVTNAGATLARAGFGGVVQAGLAASDAAEAGQGYAASLDFRGGPYFGAMNAVATVRLESRSESFATLDDPASLSDTAWNVSGDLRFDVTERLAGSLAVFAEARHGAAEGAYSIAAGLDRRFADLVVSASLRHTRFEDREDTGVFLTLTRRLGARVSAAATYDSLTGTSRLEVRRSGAGGQGWGAARAAAVRREDRTELSVSLTGQTERAALRLDADHQPAASGGPARTRISARAQSGLAVIGGRVGIGIDPGDGFVLVDRHPSLDDAEIFVRRGASDRAAARADGLGPAVLALAAPYRVQRLQVDAAGLAPGYDLGPGVYEIEPGALTGARVVVGREAYRTAVATLLLDGEPVALRLGDLTRAGSEERQRFFTNRAGRAAFNALAPGRYTARLDGRAGLEFTFEITQEAQAYVDLGRIELAADRR